MLGIFNKLKARTKAAPAATETADASRAGSQAEHPNPMTAALPPEPGPSGKLLVVGHESRFSQAVIDYALDMAHRMSYEIVALNTAPLSCNAFKPFSASQKKLCQEFQELSAENAREFKRAAEDLSIPFSHMVRFEEPDQALDVLNRDFSDIEFVITDEQPEANPDRAAENERTSQRVYVYSMI